MDTTEITIRECKANDLNSLADLTNELGYPTTETEMKLRMDNILQSPNCKTAVASVDNKVVGYIGMNRHYFWEQNGHFVRIQALIVKAELRRFGVGKKLIEYAENWAHQIDANLIVLNCGNRVERASAHKFYPKMGFEPKSTGYIKK